MIDERVIETVKKIQKEAKAIKSSYIDYLAEAILQYDQLLDESDAHDDHDCTDGPEDGCGACYQLRNTQ